MVPVKNWRCNNARGLGAPWQKLTAAQQGCKGQFASSDGPFAYRERNKSSNGVELQRSSVWLNFSIFSQEQPPSLFLNRTENFLNIRWVSKEKLNLPSPSKEQHFFFLPFLANKTRIRYLRKIDRKSLLILFLLLVAFIYQFEKYSGKEVLIKKHSDDRDTGVYASGAAGQCCRKDLGEDKEILSPLWSFPPSSTISPLSLPPYPLD